MKLLKFMALLVGMYVVGIYIPYGNLINLGSLGLVFGSWFNGGITWIENV